MQTDKPHLTLSQFETRVSLSAMASNEETLAQDQTLDQNPDKSEPNLEINGDDSSKENEDPKEALERAAELFEKGSKALDDGDFNEAADLLSRALEIRVEHFGELAPECATSYYKYGCALLYKSQAEADLLNNVPKKAPKESEKGNAPNHVEGSSSKASATDAIQDNMASKSETDEGANGKVQEDDNEGSDGDREEEEDDEDESDLDLAWKMLDIARAIVEKSPPEDTMLEVKILSFLGEVSMEREDFENSLNDYQKALSVVEKLVEPDHRRIIELNFRICMVLEVADKNEDAISYCQKAISLCKSRLNKLREENATPEANSDEGGSENSSEEQITLGAVLSELEKKLEDLQQIISTPTPLAEIMKMVAAKKLSASTEQSTDPRSSSSTSQQCAVSSGFDAPTFSASTTNSGVTDLGVVGRGVKRASLNPVDANPPAKKPATGTSAETALGSIAEAADSTGQNP